MNKRLYKIKSFTLTELLVVMAIGIVVVGLAFSVLGLLRKNMGSIAGSLSKKTEQRLLEQRLTMDMQQYPFSRYENEKLVFSSPLDSINYRFETGYILRELDTFFLAPQQKEFYFAGKRIEKGYIDACKLVFQKDSLQKTLFTYKRNDALNTMVYGD